MSDHDRDWFTTAEAAAALGLSPRSIHKAIERGTLQPTRIHARLSVITREELDRYRREHLGQVGPKPRQPRPQEGVDTP